jgi:hypothetical protein
LVNMCCKFKSNFKAFQKTYNNSDKWAR